MTATTTDLRRLGELKAPEGFAERVLALAGLWWFEELWVKAGQSVPLS